jgi:predicted nucleotidyltransferase
MKMLSEKLLNDITRRLVVEFQPEQVILFGSYAWGEPSAGSDIDLMVIVSHSDQSEYQRALRGHACLSDLEIAKDVVVKTRSEFDFFRDVYASLEHKVAKRGKVLYERGQTATPPKLAHQSRT